MSGKRIVLIVIGSLVGLIGLALTAGGIVGLVAYGTARDDDGYFATSTERFATPRFALVSDEVDLGSEGDAAGPVSLGDLARVRVRAEAPGGRAVFIGIGPRDDVEAYLQGVAYDQVDDVEFDPFEVSYEPRPGTARPAPPGAQAFWVARASGPGRQVLEWDLEGGRWSLVVMNAEAVRPVVADVDLGVEISWLLPVSIGFLIGGIVLLAGGITMVAFGARGAEGGGAAPPPPPAPGADVPPPPPPPRPRHDSPY